MKRLDQETFLSIARSIPEDIGVPPAFEKRVMARVRAGAATDFWLPWTRLLWKAAAVCLAVSVATGVVASLVEEPSPPDILAAELEHAVLAPLAPDEEVW